MERKSKLCNSLDFYHWTFSSPFNLFSFLCLLMKCRTLVRDHDYPCRIQHCRISSGIGVDGATALQWLEAEQPVQSWKAVLQCTRINTSCFLTNISNTQLLIIHIINCGIIAMWKVSE